MLIFKHYNCSGSKTELKPKHPSLHPTTHSTHPTQFLLSHFEAFPVVRVLYWAPCSLIDLRLKTHTSLKLPRIPDFHSLLFCRRPSIRLLSFTHPLLEVHFFLSLHSVIITALAEIRTHESFMFVHDEQTHTHMLTQMNR